MGGFTALYGGGRPYRNRAGLLAVVAVALSVAVALGTWAVAIPLLGVLTVAVIATLATLLCNALEVGPPGAYQFALVCAVGTGLHLQHDNPIHPAVLVLAGGTFTRTKRRARAGARPRDGGGESRRPRGRAYLDAIGTDGEHAARHHAAQLLHQAWTTLIDRQPRRRQPGKTVRCLQQAGRELQLLFAEAMTTAGSHRIVAPALAAKARALALDPLHQIDVSAVASRDEPPLGHLGAWDCYGMLCNRTPGRCWSSAG